VNDEGGDSLNFFYENLGPRVFGEAIKKPTPWHEDWRGAGWRSPVHGMWFDSWFFFAATSALGMVGVVLLTYRRLFSGKHRFLREWSEERACKLQVL
jgi:hypothetical protein